LKGSRMRWTYDLDAEALYVYLVDGVRPVRQVEMDDGAIFDVDLDGRPIGIEILSPTGGWDIAAWQTRFELGDQAVAGLLFLSTSALPSLGRAGGLIPAPHASMSKSRWSVNLALAG
jgi:uncharacterized protein YuzE